MALSTLERLNERLAETGMKQADLVRAAKVSRAAVSGWVNGNTKSIQAVYLFPVARALGVNPEWLSTGKGDKCPANVVQQTQGAYIVQSINDKHKVLMREFDKLTPKAQAALLDLLTETRGEHDAGQ